MNESNILDNDRVRNITSFSTSSSVLTLTIMRDYANVDCLSHSKKEGEDDSSPYLHGRLHPIDKHNGPYRALGQTTCYRQFPFTSMSNGRSWLVALKSVESRSN